MKQFVIFLSVLIGLVVIINSQQTAYGICIENEDWSDAPCWGKRCAYSDEPACTDPNWWKERWGPYYDYKGESGWRQKRKNCLMHLNQAVLKNGGV